jgi:50S ribosomal protein L16 3-hydroxylase
LRLFLVSASRDLSFPAGIDAEIFLHEYWQKRPLLMRAALPADSFELTAEELAGLACEPEFESRLIIEHGDGSRELRHGPFADPDFAGLPQTHWTLLVQDVDKFLPEVAKLIDRFDFVPGWRIDDIMVSFATDQGGVGPHTDAYDVFLMQAAGRRRWRISERQYTDADLLPDLEQRILSRFDTDQEWVLEPGDVLYLPPGVAHWGTAEGDCMTYSLGFRAPSQQELASDWFQHLVSISDQGRLTDPTDLRSDSLAELTSGVRDQAARLLKSLPTTASDDFQRWLGRYLTDPKPQFHIVPPEQTWSIVDLTDWLATRAGALSRHPFARLAWTQASEHRVIFFYQGESLYQPQDLLETIRLIAENRRIECSRIAELLGTTPAAAELLLQLINEGILEPVGELL